MTISQGAKALLEKACNSKLKQIIHAQLVSGHKSVSIERADASDGTEDGYIDTVSYLEELAENGFINVGSDKNGMTVYVVSNKGELENRK